MWVCFPVFSRSKQTRVFFTQKERKWVATICGWTCDDHACAHSLFLLLRILFNNNKNIIMNNACAHNNNRRSLVACALCMRAVWRYFMIIKKTRIIIMLLSCYPLVQHCFWVLFRPPFLCNIKPVKFCYYYTTHAQKNNNNR